MANTDAADPTRTMVVVGAGPGIGLAAARRFAREGYRIGLIARDPAKLDDLAGQVGDENTVVATEAADASVPAALQAALERLGRRLGPPDVVCFSPLPAVALIKPVLETSADYLAASLALNIGGAATVVGSVVPGMLERGHGTLLFTTGSGALQPSPQRAASAVTTAAETTYVQLLHDELAPHGIHAGQVIIVGPVGEGRQHEPAAVADELWNQHVTRDRTPTVLR